MTATSEELLLQRDGEVATLVLNRPESRNAIRLDMYRALPELLEGLDRDPGIKVIVVRGAGEKSFASGADITEFREVRADADGARLYNRAVEAAERALEGLRKPTIAMVHGYAIGGGAGLALACDLRFADERARIGITAARLGLVYSLESTKRLVDLVGPAQAKWILMSGEHVHADRALDLGLFNEVVPAEELARVTYDFAELLCSRAQVTVRAVKEIVRHIVAGQAEDDEVTRELRNSSFDSDDYAEGVRAFLEKRAPAFTWS